MRLFNKKGMLVFPNHKINKNLCEEEETIVFTDCYCPNGHNLISENAHFNDLNGILLKIFKGRKEGILALSPVYGCKTRVSVGINLKEGELYNFSCTECNVALPIYSKCHCGGNIFTMFLNKKADFSSFIGACNRIGCTNSYIQNGEELITSARHEAI